MDRSSLIAALLFGMVFAAFGIAAIDVIDSHVIRAFIAFFLFGSYAALVAFRTSGKKRSLSLRVQAVLGIALSCAIAALFRCPIEGYAAAVAVGLVLGFTAHKWVVHVQLP